MNICDALHPLIRAKGTDLTLRQVWLLDKVCVLPEVRCTVRGLAATGGIKKPPVTRATDKLVDVGFVRRVVDRKDRRSVFIRPTPKGTRYLALSPVQDICALVEPFIHGDRDDALLTLRQLWLLGRAAVATDPRDRMVKSLAGDVGISKASISRSADRLMAAGFIVRFRDDADRRNVILVITEEGLEALARTSVDVTPQPDAVRTAA